MFKLRPCKSNSRRISASRRAGDRRHRTFRLRRRSAAAAVSFFADAADTVRSAAASRPRRPKTKATSSRCRRGCKRQVVNYATREAPGTVIIDTPNTYLYYVLGGGQAIRYGIGVGRDGFTWSGMQTITKKAEWPDWTPPPEMIARQPYLPRHMAGGPGNPLGARAMYLGGTVYRIHGTNAPETIGTHVSSGCIRLTNEDVTDLYSRVNVGTKVIVLPMRPPRRSRLDRSADIAARFKAPHKRPSGIRYRMARCHIRARRFRPCRSGAVPACPVNSAVELSPGGRCDLPMPMRSRRS